jgi:hypothetical protein
MIMPASSPTYISTMTATKIAATRLKETTTTTMANTAAIASALSSNRPNWPVPTSSMRRGSGIEDIGRRGRAAAGADLEQAVDDRLGEGRTLIEDEGEEADEHDAPDQFGEPAIERGRVDREPDRGDADLDAGKDPEQRARRVHDGRFPAFAAATTVSPAWSAHCLPGQCAGARREGQHDEAPLEPQSFFGSVDHHRGFIS